MKKIKEDIRTGSYKRVYLLYGSEKYLKKLYRDKLKEGILAGGDEMNYSRFEGKGIDEAEVVHMAETLPFFADRRLVLIENSGWFKNQSGMADVIRKLPDTAVFLFVEDEVDKRSRFYKAVKEIGYICELNSMEERDLKLWAASRMKSDGKKITDSTMSYFLEKVGTDMENIQTEIEKLVAYAYEREVITAEDIDAICTEQISGKIFQMIDSVASRNLARALKLYHDLLMLREKPMSILYLMIRQFNILLQVKQMGAAGMPNAAISKKAGIPQFSVGKYLSQARAFSTGILLEAVRFGTEAEEQVKTGLMDDQIAVELILVKFATL